MQTIFYSWQSDLPNNKNRSFIEKSIESAIKEINNDDLDLDIAIDRDTKGTTGTPDIVSTIFGKIEKSSIFIADISFINQLSSGRKCSNPNVLIELGFAAKTLGWDRIICIFNTEYGKVEELPFDLRFRRPLTYKIDNINDKVKERILLTSIIKNEIYTILQKEDEKNDLRIYIKQQVDKEIIRISNHINKIVFSLGRFQQREFNLLLEQNIEKLSKLLSNKNIIGFLAVKDWQDFIEKLEHIINQPFFIQNTNSSFNNSIVRVIKSITTLSVLQNQRDVFINLDSEVKGFKIVDAHKMNPENAKDSYILLEDYGNDKGKVADSGIIKKYNIERALVYQMISDKHFEHYVSSICKLIESIRNYLDKTGNEFFLDPLHFRV